MKTPPTQTKRENTTCQPAPTLLTNPESYQPDDPKTMITMIPNQNGQFSATKTVSTYTSYLQASIAVHVDTVPSVSSNSIINVQATSQCNCLPQQSGTGHCAQGHVHHRRWKQWRISTLRSRLWADFGQWWMLRMADMWQVNLIMFNNG